MRQGSDRRVLKFLVRFAWIFSNFFNFEHCLNKFRAFRDPCYGTATLIILKFSALSAYKYVDYIC